MLPLRSSVSLTPRTLANLRIAKAKAEDANQRSFVFNGMELDTKFAGHLADYMATCLARATPEEGVDHATD